MTVRPLPVHGADISHHQAKVDLEAAKSAGLDWVCLKSTQGKTFIDNTYVARRDKARKINLLTSAYHFAENSSTPEAQVTHFLNTAGIKAGDMRPMLDVEDYEQGRSFFSRMTLNERTDFVGRFVARIKSELGVLPFIYTQLDLSEHFNCPLWVARYNPLNMPPKVPAPWKTYTIRQFSNGAVGVPSSFPGLGHVDLNCWNGDPDRLNEIFTVPAPVVVKPPVVTPKPTTSLDFKIHLLPGNKKQTASQINSDMVQVLSKSEARSSVVFNTERATETQRQAVSDGLGDGWTRSIDNENTIVMDKAWHLAPGYTKPSALLLAKQDPSMAGVSPNRYLNKVYAENDLAKGVVVGFLGTHLLSEANCVHTRVKGRAWREKMYPISVEDVLDECERIHNAGVPIVLAGDFNTGVFFTGEELFSKIQKRFGELATHVHDGGLDSIFLISTNKVKLSEVGKELVVDNTSDHNRVTATLHLTVG